VKSPPEPPDRRLAITTTVPIEIIYAAGLVPVDLNNVFITHPQRLHFALEAEKEGLPRTVCGWNKGVFAAALAGGFRRVVAVVQGDCSTAEAVADGLERRGVEIIPFAYPFEAEAEALERQLRLLAGRLGTDLVAAEAVRRRLAPTRELLDRLDSWTWQERLVTGGENHRYLVSASDLEGDPEGFQARLEAFLAQAARRRPLPEAVRVGFIGVPPIVEDLYERIETLGGQVVFNEIQRQFAMYRPAPSLLEQYRRYTYPYSVYRRVDDIREEARRRNIHCLVHYVQCFCFHQLEDQIFRRCLDLPILTVEGERPGPLEARDALRLENFLRQAGGRPKAVAASAPVRPEARLGLDLGSRWVKVLLLADGRVRFQERCDPVQFYRTFAVRSEGGLTLSLSALLEFLRGSAGLEVDPAGLAVRATGYGRYLARFDLAAVVPELEAHVRGARAQLGLSDFTLLDIGGQDTKVVQARDGRIADFLMNDRCAAGGGRYLENMARLLGLGVGEIGLYSADPVPLNATCATFGESEVVARIVEGVPLERICAGVNHTVFQRVLPDLQRLASETLVVTGGVASNQAVLHFLRASRLFDRVLVPPQPQFNGAIGALWVEEEGGWPAGGEAGPDLGQAGEAP